MCNFALKSSFLLFELKMQKEMPSICRLIFKKSTTQSVQTWTVGLVQNWHTLALRPDMINFSFSNMIIWYHFSHFNSKAPISCLYDSYSANVCESTTVTFAPASVDHSRVNLKMHSVFQVEKTILIHFSSSLVVENITFGWLHAPFGWSMTRIFSGMCNKVRTHDNKSTTQDDMTWACSKQPLISCKGVRILDVKTLCRPTLHVCETRLWR